jgi:hypothetical protein
VKTPISTGSSYLSRREEVSLPDRVLHNRPVDREAKMAPLVHRVEIDRSPADVFAYVTDPSRFSE